MQSRASALAAKRPLRRQTAGFQHQRFRRFPRKGIRHIIKVESHMVSFCNDRADHHADALDPALPDMTGMRYTMSALIPLFKTENPVAWEDQAALAESRRREAVYAKRMHSKFGHAHCSGLAMPILGLNSLQMRRVGQLRCDALPVHSTLLKYASRKIKARNLPQVLARCPLCKDGKETVLHLFLCALLQDQIDALQHECQQLNLPAKVLVELRDPKVLASLAAGLTPLLLQVAWGRTPRHDELRPLFLAVINGFIVLWAKRCSLHEEWRRRPLTSFNVEERQWIAFLRNRPMEKDPADQGPPLDVAAAVEDVVMQIAGDQNPDTVFASLDDSSDDDF